MHACIHGAGTMHAEVGHTNGVLPSEPVGKQGNLEAVQEVVNAQGSGEVLRNTSCPGCQVGLLCVLIRPHAPPLYETTAILGLLCTALLRRLHTLLRCFTSSECMVPPQGTAMTGLEPGQSHVQVARYDAIATQHPRVGVHHTTII